MFPELDKFWIATYGKVALTGEPIRFENYSKNNDRHYEIYAFSPAKGEFAALGRDITERKRAELKLRDSECKLRLFIEHAPASLAMFDRGMRYLSASQRWLDIHRLDYSNVTGFCHYDLIPEISAEWREAHRRGLAGEVLRSDCDCFDRRDGSVQWINWELRPWLAADGEVGGVVIFAEDITDRKLMQDALDKKRNDLKLANQLLDQKVSERTADLEAAIQAQESFSYSVSHDLRAPLRHINSFSAILEEDHGGEFSAQARSYLNRIRHASSRMGSLIDHLLELSRVNRMEIRMETVELSELALAALCMFQEIEPQRRAEHVIEPGLVVQGDHALLRQLLENLLGNSWKYTANKWPSRIEFGRTRISGVEVFYVKDNGAGFDMAYKDKLFNAFERLHGCEFEGIGIGLATAKQIVQRHGGTIWAEGAVNRGATFYFTLPLHFEQEYVSTDFDMLQGVASSGT